MQKGDRKAVVQPVTPLALQALVSRYTSREDGPYCGLVVRILDG
jgi:hypothetical protein